MVLGTSGVFAEAAGAGLWCRVRRTEVCEGPNLPPTTLIPPGGVLTVWRVGVETCGDEEVGGEETGVAALVDFRPVVARTGSTEAVIDDV
jgi:hypothetical protein